MSRSQDPSGAHQIQLDPDQPQDGKTSRFQPFQRRPIFSYPGGEEAGARSGTRRRRGGQTPPRSRSAAQRRKAGRLDCRTGQRGSLTTAAGRRRGSTGPKQGAQTRAGRAGAPLETPQRHPGRHPNAGRQVQAVYQLSSANQPCLNGNRRLWKCRAVEALENREAVSHRSHRPWKSLRDSHIPTAANTITYFEIYRKEPQQAASPSRLVLALENALDRMRMTTGIGRSLH